MMKSFESKSPSDRSKRALGFGTLEDAKAHMEAMNRLREKYPEGWNTTYWPEKPEPWIVIPGIFKEE